MRLLFATLAILIWILPVQAQDEEAVPLVVPFAQFPPFLFFAEDGQRSGFIVDLAEMIGTEIERPIAYHDVANAREWVAAQASGTSQLIPGVLRLPALAETNVFSDEVAADILKPAVLASNSELVASGVLEGLRVAVVPPAIGSEEAVLEDNTRVEYEGPHEAIIDLLSGNVDAVLMPPPVVFQLARDAGFDGQITFVGEPLREATRHVALHNSRAELMPEINEALARIEADGRLETLRQRYNITVPQPPSDVLQIGIAHLPPLSIIEGESFSGFAVEVTEELAERANVDIEFVPLAVSDWVKGPMALGLDAVAVLVITPDREARFDFPYPIVERSVAVVLDAQDKASLGSYADLAGRRVGIIGGSVFEKLLKNPGTFEIVGFETFDALYAAQVSQEIDAIVTAPDLAEQKIELLGVADALRVDILENEVINSGIALRPGLGAVRQQLNAVTPAYLVSDEYQVLRQRYFGDPVFWTPARIYGGLGAVGALVLMMLGALIWQRQRQRQREFERQQAELVREQAHAEELVKLVTELERSNRELDEFAYTASHDLKEPLRGIAINADFLSRLDVPEDGRERIDRMVSLTHRMEKLVSDLLYFSRLGRGQRVMKNLDTEHIIEGTEKELTEWIESRNGRVEIKGNLPWLNAERPKVKTVFQNLIVNGLKYNDAAEKTVEIGFLDSVEVNGRTMRDVFYVRDNGIGIKASNRDKVFQIFKRINPEGEYGPGSGAGLSFVRKIVEEYDGEIDLVSDFQTGTTFYFHLPLLNVTVQEGSTTEGAKADA